jgi:hypothetical protein
MRRATAWPAKQDQEIAGIASFDLVMTRSDCEAVSSSPSIPDNSRSATLSKQGLCRITEVSRWCSQASRAVQARRCGGVDGKGARIALAG